MTKSNFAYFDIHYALKTHVIVIEKSGGLRGVKNSGYLESILANIQNDDYYPEFLDKITHPVYSVIKTHVFNDGNKRASIALSSFFLELNGHDFCVHKYQNKMENIVVWVAENKITKLLLQDLIESILYEDDFSEALKLRLMEATMPPDFANLTLEEEY